MLRTWFHFILLVLLAVSSSMAADSVATYDEWTSIPVTTQHLGETEKGILALDTVWFVHEVDSAAWADADIPFDSTWRQCPNTFELNKLYPDDSIPGILWFRIKFHVDSTITSEALAFTLHGSGAFEVFLNGHPIFHMGQIGSQEKTDKYHLLTPDPIYIGALDPGHHTLAIRYSPPATMILAPRWAIPGFSLAVGKTADALKPAKRFHTFDTSMYMLYGGMAWIFCMIHLMLFLFYKEKRSNLFFAGFAGALGTAIILNYTAMLPFDHFWLHIISIGINTLKIGMSNMALLVVYTLFYEKRPRYFLIFRISGWILILLSYWLPSEVYTGFIIVASLELLRIILLAILQKRKHAWILGIGFVTLAATGVYQLFIRLGEVVNIFPTPDAYLAGVDNLLIMMSVYLGLDYARTNKDLKNKMLEVEQLAQEKLEQERLAKERELERIKLEEENKRKALEIDKAHKIQEANEKLAQTVSELQLANEELRNAQVQLIQSEKMASLGRLVAGVAHEVNNPIGAVRSSMKTFELAVQKLKALFESDPDCDVASNRQLQRTLSALEDSGRVMDQGTQRVARIVRKLKSFARLDEAELQNADVDEMITDTLDIYEHELKHGIKLIRDYPDLPSVICYPAQINQLLVQLLDNANQAIDKEGTITVHASVGVEKVILSVTDNGCGIAAHHIDKVLEPGFTLWGVGVGVGMGLTICYQIALAHKGNLEIESTSGEGTTVTLRFPTHLENSLPGAQESDNSM